jgi:nucleoside-diphosphate-sugar epimerase
LLRLADIVGEDEVRARGEQMGAPALPPRPELAGAKWLHCDVTDAKAVRAVCDGVDAVVNLTVNRSDERQAFLVNVGGAYNVFAAAAGAGVRRVIHTGPVNVAGMAFDGDNRYEFGLDESAPLRPGADLYALTKHLSFELADAFVRDLDVRSGLDIVTLLVSRLRPADRYDNRDHNVVIPYSTAWSDLASAFLAALRAPELPSRSERFFIAADLPMGKYSVEKARRLLGYRAKHRFEPFFTADGEEDAPTY